MDACRTTMFLYRDRISDTTIHQHLQRDKALVGWLALYNHYILTTCVRHYFKKYHKDLPQMNQVEAYQPNN